MKKLFATFIVLATLALMTPADAFGQSYSYRRVYRNGRWYTIRVYNPPRGIYRGNHYGWRNSYRGNRYGWGSRGISPRERARLTRQSYRLYNMRSRMLRDNRISPREYRRWDRSTDRYRRSVRRARID